MSRFWSHCLRARVLTSIRLVFFRQIAASIYRKQKRWSQSIALSKQDRLFKDAIETAAVSGKEDVVEELLRYVSNIYLGTRLQLLIWCLLVR